MVLKPCCPYRSSAKTDPMSPISPQSTLPSTTTGAKETGAQVTQSQPEKQG